MTATLQQLVRRLSDPEQPKRDKAYNVLRNWMQGQKSGLDFADYLLIWKGLTYMLWLADRVPVIRDVSIKIAKTTSYFNAVVSDERLPEFLASFLIVIQMEWEQLDKWRIEKFQMMVKILIAELMDQCQYKKWDPVYVQGIISALIGTSPCLLIKPRKNAVMPTWWKAASAFHQPMGPTGLTLQIIENMMSEWEKINRKHEVTQVELVDQISKEAGKVTKDALASILSFMAKLLASEHTENNVLKAVVEKFLKPLLAPGFFEPVSRTQVQRMVATMLFRVAAAETASQMVRDYALKLIGEIDNELDDPIDYADLSQRPPLTSNFARSFLMLEPNMIQTRSLQLPTRPEKFKDRVASNVNEEDKQDDSKKDQDDLKNDQDEVKNDQDEVKNDQDDLKNGQDDLKNGQDDLKKGQDDLKKGQDDPKKRSASKKRRRKLVELPTLISCDDVTAEGGESTAASSTRSPIKKLRFQDLGDSEIISVYKHEPIASISNRPPPCLDRRPIKSVLRSRTA